ncbi:MAG TPA: glycosyltransferase [Verrucomicrobiae bacterium]|nr:glycosyltransferase [Verrucomicrobiae bacterium]
MTSIAIIWAQFGPYHLARVVAAQQAAPGVAVHGIELSDQTREYLWRRTQTNRSLHTLFPGVATEELGFWKVFLGARRKLADLEVQVCLVPSYWPRQSLAALLAAKSLRLRTVMMNETHAGTARAWGLAHKIKRLLVRCFDAALVGGAPQARYFESLGMSPDSIFPCYDAVDNDYFAQAAQAARLNAAAWRKKLTLPQRYFLSLGRFVPKKNLHRLIVAYHRYLNCNKSPGAHLVLVGSGPEESSLKSLCHELGIPCHEKETAGDAQDSVDTTENERAGVHFYGFRQIEENAVFYGLAEAFILPSTREEWGLVVNEAMASGLPVIVSNAAGCAEDLLPALQPQDAQQHDCVKDHPVLKRLIRRNGFVFDPESPEEMAEAMLTIDHNPGARPAFASQSISIVQTVSCQHFGRNALSAAHRALAGPPRKRPRNARAHSDSGIESVGWRKTPRPGSLAD